MRKQKPVQEIELSEKHIKLKIILLVVFIAIAIVAFTFGILGCLSTDAGWHRIESSSAGSDRSGEFAFYYHIDKGGTKASNELKSVTAAYSDACLTASRVFDETTTYDGVSNLATVNKNVNKDVVVDPALYKAFETLSAANDRSIFLAPIYSRYYSLFYEPDELTAATLDPYRNEEVAREFAEIAAFASDPEHVRIALGGDNTVRLVVSDEYAEYADANGIATFIDLFALKNAFIIDHVADRLVTVGIDGLISSLDGMYTRSFGENGKSYTVGIFDADGEYVYGAGSFTGSGCLASVRFRNYGLRSDTGYDLFYTFSDGKTVTPFIDPADGLYKSAISDFLAYTRKSSCVSIAVVALKEYIGSTDIADSARTLAASGVYSVYCENRTIVYNDEALDAALVPFESEEVKYTKKYSA